MITDNELIARALSATNPRTLSPNASCGTVGSAIVTEEENVYTGVCIDTACSMGFCAEHAAAAAMITAGESRVITVVAVGADGTVMSPCGRCREFLSQLDPGNTETRVLLAGGRVVSLRSLLPEYWAE